MFWSFTTWSAGSCLFAFSLQTNGLHLDFTQFLQRNVLLRFFFFNHWLGFDAVGGSNLKISHLLIILKCRFFGAASMNQLTLPRAKKGIKVRKSDWCIILTISPTGILLSALCFSMWVNFVSVRNLCVSLKYYSHNSIVNILISKSSLLVGPDTDENSRDTF